jgi:hypothetical protein
MDWGYKKAVALPDAHFGMAYDFSFYEAENEFLAGTSRDITTMFNNLMETSSEHSARMHFDAAGGLEHENTPLLTSLFMPYELASQKLLLRNLDELFNARFAQNDNSTMQLLELHKNPCVTPILDEELLDDMLFFR